VRQTDHWLQGPHRQVPQAFPQELQARQMDRWLELLLFLLVLRVRQTDRWRVRPARLASLVHRTDRCQQVWPVFQPVLPARQMGHCWLERLEWPALVLLARRTGHCRLVRLALG
jgi:hypothetical protein